jgi:hypothetical protein
MEDVLRLQAEEAAADGQERCAINSGSSGTIWCREG